MSYSFQVAGDSKESVTGQIRTQFDSLLKSQPIHAADKEAAVVAAQALVRILADPGENEEILVNVHGSLNWRHDMPEELKFLSASLAVNVLVRNKPTG